MSDLTHHPECSSVGGDACDCSGRVVPTERSLDPPRACVKKHPPQAAVEAAMRVYAIPGPCDCEHGKLCALCAANIATAVLAAFVAGLSEAAIVRMVVAAESGGRPHRVAVENLRAELLKEVSHA